MTFFEEFKRLETICNDMFSCKSGVTEYITRMEQSADRGRVFVDGWDADYKALKHLRWLRNQIAHDADVAGLCKQEDLTKLRHLHKRVLSQQDPLAVLTKASKPKTAAKQKPKPAQTGDTPKDTGSAKPKAAAKSDSGKQKPKKQSRAGAVILLILVILLFAAGLGILYLDVSGRVPLSQLWDTICGFFNRG